jgi:hypothetical protein
VKHGDVYETDLSKKTEKIASANVKKEKSAGYRTQADLGWSSRSSTTDARICG